MANIFNMFKERKIPTPSGTAPEKFTDEEGLNIYGFWGWLECKIKSCKPHDSRRHQRKVEARIKATKSKPKTEK